MQDSGVRSREPAVRGRNEEHRLSTFCLLRSARRLDIKRGALGWLECWQLPGSSSRSVSSRRRNVALKYESYLVPEFCPKSSI